MVLCHGVSAVVVAVETGPTADDQPPTDDEGAPVSVKGSETAEAEPTTVASAAGSVTTPQDVAVISTI